MYTILVLGFCLAGIIFGSVSTASIRTEEGELARLKRQFETTCAFYRWSHCPGKKEVDNANEEKSIANAKKEMSYVDSEEFLNEMNNEQESKDTKASRIAKQRYLRKLINLLFLKGKTDN